MKIQGKDKFLMQLASLPRMMREEARRSLEVSAEETTDLMKRFAPKDEHKLVVSIGYTFDFAPGGGNEAVAQARAAKVETGLAVTMYAGDETTMVTNKRGQRFQNARIQEHGRRTKSGKIIKHPFFFPAYRLMHKRALSRLRRALRTGARKAFGR
ncbi:hypothetical protein [Chelativorans sp.]|uniref:hypothetical protein n=1 Tax=Chelativorans sp. TaxID=2203393 RepID=UPI002811D860|nr:hypothetical protein [Chelativorans sp.]